LTLSSSPGRGLRFGKAGVENPPENRDPLLFSSCALLCSSSTLQWSYQHGLPAWLVGAIALMPPQPGSAALGRTVFPRPACDAGSPRRGQPLAGGERDKDVAMKRRQPARGHDQ